MKKTPSKPAKAERPAEPQKAKEPEAAPQEKKEKRRFNPHSRPKR